MMTRTRANRWIARDDCGRFIKTSKCVGWLVGGSNRVTQHGYRLLDKGKGRAGHVRLKLRGASESAYGEIGDCSQLGKLASNQAAREARGGREGGKALPS